jgi:hypothetical protein
LVEDFQEGVKSPTPISVSCHYSFLRKERFPEKDVGNHAFMALYRTFM